MRRFAFLLWLFTLAAGCIVEDKPVDPQNDGGVDAGPDAGICGSVTCPADQPVCIDELECVQCTADEDEYCTERGLVCDIELSDCGTSCSRDDDCTDPKAARCGANVCKPCTEDAQCDGIDGLGDAKNACFDGECVDCTPASEGDTCPSNTTCNPATRECTGIRVGALDICEECVADSQCGENDAASDAHRCVPMFYELPDNRFPNSDTGFCLKSIELGGTCMNPFRIPVTRSSLSGADPDEYCGINEELATCPAVRALIEDQDCNPTNGDDDCPQPSGLCRELPGMTNTCTYLCASIIECLENNPAGRPGSTCDSSGTGGAGGAGGDDYCGG